jgi:hypothetical protein
MKITKITFVLLGGLTFAGFTRAQQPSAPADTGASPVATAAVPAYTPPTHSEKFRTYLGHTYGLGSILEAGARAGIDQGLYRPSEWQLGAKGYAERFGSAMGVHAVRGTTAYLFGELFAEDLRHLHCGASCSGSDRFKIAFENTFAARKGSDGHLAFSVARLIGPIAGGLVVSTWRPQGFRRGQVVREIGMTYGLGFMRNLARQLVKR